MHAYLLEQAVALTQVARSAGGDDVLPDRLAPAAPRHDVIQGQPAPVLAAVDAAPAVAREERPPRDLPLHRAWHPHVLDEPDHMRPGIGVARRAERLVELLEHLGLALEHEDVRPSHGRHVQWLVARVEDENLRHDSKM